LHGACQPGHFPCVPGAGSGKSLTE
jgi:hypothetical protein